MTKKMLIDATHEEETRVAVVLGDNRLDDFDFENKIRKTLRGNIYLVKVTRVEPSLQAAFVDFGGNRHGFLPFPEIHPDYYRIPIADREALIAEQDAADIEEVDEDEEAVNKGSSGESKEVEFVGGEEDVDETPTFKRNSIKHRYKIQEVIKRNQIMLIQVNKEERGNKGAAVSTYISLPGRYCVLMPNSPRAGGVSRKVNNAKDRQRLKKILTDLNVPDGMSVIIRTAGISRTKAEIKRDFEYLMRLWDKIRDLTLKSTAPEIVHEEGDLIKRAIRDLYRREISEIVVDGENGYKRARDFMKMLMPSHAKRVKQYKDDNGVPLFFSCQVEKQIEEIYSINVRLRSGGYIVINPTEALISIDVNSGKATKGRHIEETALRTNVEAAEEVARQLRLRDLGGLVVIDFIDMEENKNNRIVERHLKEAMQRDRARIQFGRISAFGLLELSRQRMRPSLVETNFEVCEHCHGIGVVRTIETSAAVALRAIEEEGLRGRANAIKMSVNPAVALYLFNNKRDMLAEIEEKYSMQIEMAADEDLIKPDYNIEIVDERKDAKPLVDLKEPDFKGPEIKIEGEDDNGGGNKRRRRRSRRGGRRRNGNRNKDQQENAENSNSQSDSSKDQTSAKEETTKDDNAKDKKSSRGRKSTRGQKTAKAAPKDDDKKSDDVKQDQKSDKKETAEDKKKKPAAKSKKAPAKKSSDKADKEKSDSKAKTSDKADVVSIEDRKEKKPKATKKKSNDDKVDIKAKDEKSDDKPSGDKKGWWQR